MYFYQNKIFFTKDKIKTPITFDTWWSKETRKNASFCKRINTRKVNTQAAKSDDNNVEKIKQNGADLDVCRLLTTIADVYTYTERKEK